MIRRIFRAREHQECPRERSRSQPMLPKRFHRRFTGTHGFDGNGISVSKQSCAVIPQPSPRPAKQPKNVVALGVNSRPFVPLAVENLHRTPVTRKDRKHAVWAENCGRYILLKNNSAARLQTH